VQANCLDGSCDRTALLKFPGAINAAAFRCVPRHRVPSVSCGRCANLHTATSYLETGCMRRCCQAQDALTTEGLNVRMHIYKYSYDVCQWGSFIFTASYLQVYSSIPAKRGSDNGFDAALFRVHLREESCRCKRKCVTQCLKTSGLSSLLRTNTSKFSFCPLTVTFSLLSKGSLVPCLSAGWCC